MAFFGQHLFARDAGQAKVLLGLSTGALPRRVLAKRTRNANPKNYFFKSKLEISGY